MSEQEIIQKLRSDIEARKTYLANLKAKYEEYQVEGGDLPAMAWALDYLGAAIWSELFQYKGSSYPITLAGLTRRHAYATAQAGRNYQYKR